MVKDLDFGWVGMEWHSSKLKIPAQSPILQLTIYTQCTHPGSIQFVSSKFGGVSPNQSWKWVIGSWMLERSNSLTAVRRGCLKVASENNCCNMLRERKRIWGRFESSVCLCVCDEVLTELATQAPGEPSSDQKRGEGDEDEEEECVYMFRYPRGFPEVNRSASHPESPSTFLTVSLRVCVCVFVFVCVCVGQPEVMQPCDWEAWLLWNAWSSPYVVLCQMLFFFYPLGERSLSPASTMCRTALQIPAQTFDLLDTYHCSTKPVYCGVSPFNQFHHFLEHLLADNTSNWYQPLNTQYSAQLQVHILMCFELKVQTASCTA